MFRWISTAVVFGLLALHITVHADSFDQLQQNSDASELLRWAPPELVNPQTVSLVAESYSLVRLDPNQDYIIQMPRQPFQRSLVIEGGHNIVLIGGEIYIPWQGDNPSISSRTALKIKHSTGIVHIEGLLLRGDDISEGIQIDAPQATIQLQNIGIFNVRARDQVNFSDNHPDLIQTYGNVADLRIDRFTGTSDYQGLFFKADYNGPHGAIHISRTNIIGEPTARQLIWFQQQEGAFPVTLENVWVDVPEGNSFGDAIWPNIYGGYPSQAQIGYTTSTQVASWPAEMTPSIVGQVFEGMPPEGNFVNPEDIGISYISPGYM
jgi:hypothetical protein